MRFVDAVRSALLDALADRSVVLLSQLGRWGLGGVTEGLHARYAARVLTMPNSENLMHGAAMGLALAGMRPVVLNERMDFIALAMDLVLRAVAKRLVSWQERIA